MPRPSSSTASSTTGRRVPGCGVPLGKLGTERAVPFDAATVTALDGWTAQRGPQRHQPHPRTATPTDFLFTEHDRRLKAWRIRAGLRAAVAAAGITGPRGQPLNVTPHQLRHTYATELANAGMSLQALMALLGHVTPEMTLRYATLASPTLRAAYDEAMGKVRKLLPVALPGRPGPAKLDWIASEFLKTRVAHGYCSRREPRETARLVDPAHYGRLIELTFVTVRLRTKVTKGPGSRAAGLAMVFKLLQAAQEHWRYVNGAHLVALVRAGGMFEKESWPSGPSKPLKRSPCDRSGNGVHNY